MDSTSSLNVGDLPRLMSSQIAQDVVIRLSQAAWAARENAFILGQTKVGCSLLTAAGKLYRGCNIEHRFRCHDVHAEVNAIANMIAAEGQAKIVGVFVAAERERFTPCGGCMDWIMQFARDTDCEVFSQSAPQGEIRRYTAHELMPFYPR